MPKIVDREAMQRRILQAGRACFLAEGYHATKMTDVAKAAGLAKGTLYLYFKSKDEMMLAMVKQYFSDARTEIESYPQPPSLDVFLYALRMSLQPERLNATRMFFDVLGPGFAQPEARIAISEFFAWLGQRYTQQLGFLARKGELRDGLDLESAGRALAAMLDGLVIHLALFNPSEEEFTANREATISLLAEGLRRAEGSSRG